MDFGNTLPTLNFTRFYHESLKAYLAPTGLVSEPRGDLTFRGDRGLVSEPRGDLTCRIDLTCRGDLRLEVPKTGLKQHKLYSVNNTYPPRRLTYSCRPAKPPTPD